MTKAKIEECTRPEFRWGVINYETEELERLNTTEEDAYSDCEECAREDEEGTYYVIKIMGHVTIKPSVVKFD